MTQTPPNRVVLAIIASLSAVTAAAAQQSAPARAYSVGAAFDAGRSRLVLFGGFAGGGYVGDTWEFDGRSWTLVASTGPSARNGPDMVYDAAREQIVLFGGDTRTTGALGDTWVFGREGWRRAATDGPPARSTQPMVYDTRRGRVLLFGGASGATIFGDTWQWDGTRWSPVDVPGPPARALHGLAYDASRDRVVLFGGAAVLGPDQPSFGDTWEFDGTRWEAIDVRGPSARDHLAMAYDPERRAVVLHGGGRIEDQAAETWIYRDRTWTMLTTSGPARRFARLVFDSRTRTMLLYGGFDRQPSNEVWRLEGSNWVRVWP